MIDRPKRRPRDPEATREAILEAASSLLAKDGPEGISLSQVAHLAGVNRGTAYQHFETRENLIQATVAWVSDKFYRATFGDPATIGERRVEEVDIADLTGRMTQFAMENPELCRVWLMQVLALPDPATDTFWREYVGSIGRFAQTDLAEPGMDVEVASVIFLSGTILWPVWARAHTGDAAGTGALSHRFTQECLRLSMYGTMRSAAYPQVAEQLAANKDK